MHDVGVRVRAFDHVEDRLEIDLAFAEWAVSGEVLPAFVILQVHVDRDWKKVPDDFRGVGAAFLELADVRRELAMPRVDRFHRRVGFIARLHGRPGVLVQPRAEPEIVHRLRIVVQPGDDRRFVLREVVAAARDAVWRQHHEAAAMFLDRLAPLNQLREIFLSRGRVGQLNRCVPGDQRNPMFVD